MFALAVLPLAFAPGLFWLWYFYRRGIYHPEPRRLIIRTFVLGMVVTVPAAALEGLLLLPTGLVDLGRLTAATVVSFLIIGPVEEGLKFLVVRRTVYRFFDEPVDGIIYGAAAALGFASLENLFYMVQFGWWVILVRGPVSTVAHVVFAALWAYPLGNRAVGRSGRTAVAGGLLASMALHGAFDFFLFTESWPAVFSVGLLAAGMVWLWRAIPRAQRASPLRERLAVRVVQCARCEARSPESHAFCSACGASLSPVKDTRWCGNCSTPAPPGLRYCTACGYRFVRQLPSSLPTARRGPQAPAPGAEPPAAPP